MRKLLLLFLVLVLLIASPAVAALDFNGTDNGASIFSGSLNQDVGTISMWVAPDFLPTDASSHHFTDSDARHAFFHEATDFDGIAMYNDGRQTNFTSANWSTGVWTHFAFLYNKTGDVQRLFIDGVEQTGSGATGTWGSTVVGTFYIGHDTGGDVDFDGRMAEIATWNVVLTDAEVVSLSKRFSPSLVRPTSLLGYWKFIRDGRPSHGPNAATLDGSPAVTAHPPMLYPY